MTARRLAAGWVVPVGAPPIAGGAVLTDAAGRIAAVGPDADVPAPPGVPAERLGSAVLLPGLVNTHTHLELTGFGGQVPDREFHFWIRRIYQLKLGRSPEDFLAAAREGVRDCLAAGVTTVADTGDSGAVMHAMAEGGLRGIYYQEVFGPDPGQCDTSLEGLQRRVSELAPLVSERVRLGVSPHAPYTVSGPLYAATAGWAREAGLPLAVHIAESEAESLLLGSAEGPFADGWRGRGIPLPALPGRTPVAWLTEHGVLGADTLCIHAINLSEADLALLAASGAAVAHCPLSNLRHHGRTTSLAALRRAGVRVGVGTDSVASVDRLDLFAEVRAARAAAGLDATAALRLVTRDAAAAIGMGEEIGTLAPGRWGDMVALRLPEPAPGDPAQVLEAVLAARPGDALATWVAGRELARA